jgi:hypothetical protein
MHLSIYTPIFFLIYSIFSITHASTVNGTVKFLDLNPLDTVGIRYHQKFKLQDKVIFFTANRDRGIEIWRHEAGKENIERFFGGKDFATNLGNTFIPWDNDKLAFWVADFNKWYVTDGTFQNTKELTELAKLQTLLGSENSIAGQYRFHFIKTLSSGKVLFIHDELSSRPLFIYDPSNETFEKKEVSFAGKQDNIVQSIGDYIFYSAVDFTTDFVSRRLWRFNINTLEVDNLTASTGHDSFSFHPRNRGFGDNPLISETSEKIDGFYQVKKENEQIYTLHLIDGDTGEIRELPFTSVQPFGMDVVYNSMSMYFTLYQGSNSGLIKLNLEDFSYEQIVIPSQEHNCVINDYIKYSPVLITEKGVLVSASVPVHCNNRAVNHLFFIDEKGEAFVISDVESAMGFHFQVELFGDQKLYVSAANYGTNIFELWEINLEEMKVSRMHYKESSNGPLHSSLQGYALNGKFYSSLINGGTAPGRKPVFTSHINIHNKTIDPIHSFSAVTASTYEGGFKIQSTSNGIYTIHLSSPGPKGVFNLTSDYELELLIERDDLPLASSTEPTPLFSDERIESFYYIDYQKENDESFFLTSLNSVTGEKVSIAELPKENITWPKWVKQYEEGRVLIDYIGALTFAVVDLNDGNIYTPPLEENQNEYKYARLCGDSALFISSDHALFSEKGKESKLIEFDNIVSLEFLENDFAVFVTRNFDIAVGKYITRIHSLECTTGEFLTHSESYTDWTYIDLGINGWVYVRGGDKNNTRFNLYSSVEELFDLSYELEEDISGSLFKLYDTKFGTYGAHTYQKINESGIATQKTDIIKFDGITSEVVASIDGIFQQDKPSKYDPYSRIFGFYRDERSHEMGDLIYFSPFDEKFHQLDIVPGKGSYTEINSKHYTSSGHLYLNANGHNGAELLIINLNCLDFVECELPLDNSAPQFISTSEYSYKTGQKIYIPIRATDSDRDNISYRLENAPSWLTIVNDVIQGKVPENVDTNINDIVLVARDSFEGKSSTKFTLVWQPKRTLEAEFKSIAEEVPDNPPAPPVVTPPQKSESTSEGGGGSMGALLILLFITACRKNIQSRVRKNDQRAV